VLFGWFAGYITLKGIMSTFHKSLIWGSCFGLFTAYAFESFSFGIAHGSGWLIFLGAVLAMAWEWPGSGSLLWLGVYQFLYGLGVALTVGAVIGVFRIRAERLAAERTQGAAVPLNMSIDTDPQQQEAASPLMLVVRSFLR
jgi:hypothetical protein